MSGARFVQLWGCADANGATQDLYQLSTESSLAFLQTNSSDHCRSLKFYQKSIEISEKGLQLRLRVAPGGTWDSRGGAPSLPCSPPSAACGKIATRCASSRARHHHTTSDLMKLLWDRSVIDIFPGDCIVHVCISSNSHTRQTNHKI